MKENDYFRPTFPTFESVESFAIVQKSVLFKNETGLCIVAFQATVSKSHPLKRAGLKNIQAKVKELHGALKLYVVFVTKEGGGISKLQQLGETPHKADATYRQCVLYGMAIAKEDPIEGVKKVKMVDPPIESTAGASG